MEPAKREPSVPEAGSVLWREDGLGVERSGLRRGHHSRQRRETRHQPVTGATPPPVVVVAAIALRASARSAPKTLTRPAFRGRGIDHNRCTVIPPSINTT